VSLRLEQAGRVPLLTAAEEVHLGTLIQLCQQWEGGPAAAPAVVRRLGLRACERMVSANLRLVASGVKRYRGAAEQVRLDLVDLLHEGVIGLQWGRRSLTRQGGSRHRLICTDGSGKRWAVPLMLRCDPVAGWFDGKVAAAGAE
jgi:hypothetical protein